jgi:hypothetical protein
MSGVAVISTACGPVLAKLGTDFATGRAVAFGPGLAPNVSMELGESGLHASFFPFLMPGNSGTGNFSLNALA